MEYRLLGQVEAWSADGQVDVGPPKQRLLLAVLALKVNRLVPVDQLVDLTWPSSPPQTAQHAIHVRVSRLRAALATGAADAAEIVTHGAAYVLRTDPMSIDAHRFRALVTDARAITDDATKVTVFREAAGMWHGPPLAGVATPVVVDQLCRGLEETRLAAVEDCLDAELRLGRQTAVVDELTDLTAQHPYRQRLLAQLMLALYRAGRGPDALGTYRLARDRLADELGLDLAPPLPALYDAILRGDADLDVVVEPRIPRTTESAGRVAGRMRTNGAGPAGSGGPGGPGGRRFATVELPAPRLAGDDVPVALDSGSDRTSGRRLEPAPHRTGRLVRFLNVTAVRLLISGSAIVWRRGVVAMASATLEAVRLTKRYGARTALEELSFTAGPGEVLGLLGSNGAGKTTTIRLLTTMLTPTSGEFTVAGVPHTRQTEIRRRVGVLPESAGYPGHQSGHEYLAYHARLYGMNKSESARTATRLLAEVGLDQRGESRISTYSRGMRQRLGIAGALLNEPAVVLLDEPTLGLDPAGQRQVLDIIRDIAGRTGATVVLSTHTLPEVEEVCSRVLILDAGRMAVSGTVEEVVRAVATRRSGVLRVPVELAGRAAAALTALPGVTVAAVDDRPDLLRVSRTTGPGAVDPRAAEPDAAMNAALQAVLSAGVPVLSYEVEGARLADAFLAMTGGVR